MAKTRFHRHCEIASSAGAMITRRSMLKAGMAVVISPIGLCPYVVSAQEVATPSPDASPVADPKAFAIYGLKGMTAEGWPIEIVLATPDYLRMAGREDDIGRLRAQESLVFITTRELPGALTGANDSFTIALRIDGEPVASQPERKLLKDDRTKREEAFIFGDFPAGISKENHLLEVILPSSETSAPKSFIWITPLVVQAVPGTPVPGSESGTDDSMNDILETVVPVEEIEICSQIDDRESESPSFA